MALIARRIFMLDRKREWVYTDAMNKKGRYVYEWPRPMVTVDMTMFELSAPKVRVLLIRRGNEPFKGKWAVPGGFVDMDEELEDAAVR